MSETDCHVREWAALLGVSVPEDACERRLEFRPRGWASPESDTGWGAGTSTGTGTGPGAGA